MNISNQSSDSHKMLISDSENNEDNKINLNMGNNINDNIPFPETQNNIDIFDNSLQSQKFNDKDVKNANNINKNNNNNQNNNQIISLQEQSEIQENFYYNNEYKDTFFEYENFCDEKNENIDEKLEDNTANEISSISENKGKTINVSISAQK